MKREIACLGTEITFFNDCFEHLGQQKFAIGAEVIIVVARVANLTIILLFYYISELRIMVVFQL